MIKCNVSPPPGALSLPSLLELVGIIWIHMVDILTLPPPSRFVPPRSLSCTSFGYNPSRHPPPSRLSLPSPISPHPSRLAPLSFGYIWSSPLSYLSPSLSPFPVLFPPFFLSLSSFSLDPSPSLSRLPPRRLSPLLRKSTYHPFNTYCQAFCQRLLSSFCALWCRMYVPLSI
jgi:hypothetical protein